MTEAAEENREPLSESANMTFVEHLGDLRMVLIRSIISIFVLAGPCLYFYDRVLALFIRLLPEGSEPLQSLSPVEVAMVTIKTSLLMGLFVAFPYVLYQIWSFIGPGLYKQEQRVVFPFVVSGWGLFMTGIGFCYFIVLPLCIRFLMEFSKVEGIEPRWQAARFVNFCLGTCLGFGVGFNLPVVLVGMAMLGLVTAEFLAKYRSYAFVLAFVIGALLTPTDVLSMFLLAGPLCVLYEASIIVIRVSVRKKD